MNPLQPLKGILRFKTKTHVSMNHKKVYSKISILLCFLRQPKIKFWLPNLSFKIVLLVSCKVSATTYTISSGSFLNECAELEKPLK